MKKLIMLAMALFYFVIWTGERKIQVSEYYQEGDWLIAKSVYNDTIYRIPVWTVTLIEEKS